jgi:hypothetical protein
VRGQRHASATPDPRERPDTHCTGGWMGLRAGLNRDAENLALTGIRSPDRPALSSQINNNNNNNNNNNDFWKS